MKKNNLLTEGAERESAREELILNWERLTEHIPYAIFLTDRDCNIMMANSAALSLLEWNGDIRNAKCHQLLHDSDSPVENCPMMKTLKSGTAEQTEMYEHRIGRHLLVHTWPVVIESDILGIIHTVRDITEQKNSEQNSNLLIDIYSSSINELKAREVKSRKGRDAFLNMLEDLNESYSQLEDLFLKLVRVMVNALDAKSPWTKGHSERVALYAEEIAKQMNFDDDEVKEIRLAGLLHDIGKIGTYDSLLDKPGRLTKEEFEIVKKHPEQGANILKDINQLNDIIPFIIYHHEKLDGKGYPHSLKGDDIPLGARILHVADSFDSMTSDRPYRPAPGVEFALSEFEKYKDTQFDQDVVEAFLKVLKSARFKYLLSAE